MNRLYKPDYSKFCLYREDLDRRKSAGCSRKQFVLADFPAVQLGEGKEGRRFTFICTCLVLPVQMKGGASTPYIYICIVYLFVTGYMLSPLTHLGSLCVDPELVLSPCAQSACGSTQFLPHLNCFVAFSAKFAFLKLHRNQPEFQYLIKNLSFTPNNIVEYFLKQRCRIKSKMKKCFWELALKYYF